MWIAREVLGDQFLFDVLEDALHGTFRSLLKGGVHFLGGRGLLDQHHEVNDRNIRRGDAHGVTIELTLQFGQHQADGLGGPGRSRNHRKRRCAGPPQILVGQVQDALVVGVSVNRGHGSLEDLKAVVEDFRRRRQAVRRAGGVREDMVLGRVIHLLIHAQHDGDVFTLGRSGNDDLLHRAFQVFLGILGFGEQARGLNNHLYAERGPVDFGRIFHFEDADRFAIDADGVVPEANLGFEDAENRVVLQQMSESLGVGNIVNSDDFDPRIIQGGAQKVSSDAPEPVDSNLDWHNCYLRCVSVD